jgi:hypothetical protein
MNKILDFCLLFTLVFCDTKKKISTCVDAAVDGKTAPECKTTCATAFAAIEGRYDTAPDCTAFKALADGVDGSV